MKYPLSIEIKIKKVLDLLDPYSNLKRLIKVYHNRLEVQDKTFFLNNKIHVFGLGKAASYEVDAIVNILNDAGQSNVLHLLK